MNLPEIYREPMLAASRQFRHVRAFESLQWAQERAHAMTIIEQARPPSRPGGTSLRTADPETVAAAVLQAGAMGLTLNPLLSHCYLIPRKARAKQDRESWDEFAKVPVICYASPSYRGLVHVATISGAVEFVIAEVVMRADIFEHPGPISSSPPIHKIDVRKERTESAALGAYACAKVGDAYLTEWIDAATIQRIRKKSEFPNGMMWTDLWTEGWRKAVIRRGQKHWPKVTTGPFAEAVQVMNRFEGIPDEPASAPEGAHLTITDEQAMELEAMLHDHAPDNAEWVQRQTGRLARRYGVTEIRNLAAENFEAARDFLVGFLRQRAE